MTDARTDRRAFVKRCVMGGCGLALGACAVRNLLEGGGGGLRVGFRNDAPASLWKWSREADWYETSGRLLRCLLCPHECILGENDRGFCRVRVVKDHKLHSIAYGNPCAVHLDRLKRVGRTSGDIATARNSNWCRRPIETD